MINVYLISSEIEDSICYKIGFTRRDPEYRIKEMKTGNASELKIISTFSSKWGTQIESRLHKIFKHKKISGEWFTLSNSDISKFNRLCEETHNNLEFLSENNTWFQKLGRY